MYLKEKLIRILKIKNAVLAVFTILNLIVSVSWEFYLVVRYWGDWYTIAHAKATPEFIFWVIVGPVILLIVYISKEWIGDAYFYNGYFEGDLDGAVNDTELAEVMGRHPGMVAAQLKLFSLLYMKNYTNKGGKTELASKTCTCECVNCGAVIEKKMYFTGQCEYCGSSDLRARVLSGDRFYSISNELKGSSKSYDYYTAKFLQLRRIVFPILMGLSLFCMLIAFCMGTEALSNFNNEEYYRETVLDVDKHLQSYELIRYNLIETIITSAFVFFGLMPVLINRILRIRLVMMADLTAKFFTTIKVPFIAASRLPSAGKMTAKSRLSRVRRAMRKGYLRNCTIEKHNGVMQVALGKKIVKDSCPSCGAPVTGAVYSDYVCRYCDRKIMDVVVKK